MKSSVMPASIFSLKLYFCFLIVWQRKEGKGGSKIGHGFSHTYYRSLYYKLRHWAMSVYCSMSMSSSLLGSSISWMQIWMFVPAAPGSIIWPPNNSSMFGRFWTLGACSFRGSPGWIGLRASWVRSASVEGWTALMGGRGEQGSLFSGESFENLSWRNCWL